MIAVLWIQIVVRIQIGGPLLARLVVVVVVVGAVRRPVLMALHLRVDGVHPQDGRLRLHFVGRCWRMMALWMVVVMVGVFASRQAPEHDPSDEDVLAES